MPGTHYITGSSGGSCFAAGTQVLMSDGSLKSIESVQEGDKLQTLLGPCAVTLTVKTSLRRRPLYSFSNLEGVLFTSTHPFVRPEHNGETFAAIDPESLQEFLPLMRDLGVLKLEPGVMLSAWNIGKQKEDVFTIGNIIEHSTVSSDTVYDLILTPDLQTMSIPPYIVVSPHKNLGLIVGAEAPPAGVLPHFTISWLQIMNTTLSHLTQVITSFPLSQHEGTFCFIERILLHNLPMLVALKLQNDARVQMTDNDTVTQLILSVFKNPQGSYNQLTGDIFMFIFGRLSELIFGILELEPMIYLPTETEPDPVLAISLLYVDCGRLDNFGKITFNGMGKDSDIHAFDVTQAKYRTQFVYRFYRTAYLKGILPAQRILLGIHTKDKSIETPVYLPPLTKITARFQEITVTMGVATLTVSLLLRSLPRSLADRH